MNNVTFYHMISHIYFAPGWGAKYCLYVCLSDRITAQYIIYLQFCGWRVFT